MAKFAFKRFNPNVSVLYALFQADETQAGGALTAGSMSLCKHGFGEGRRQLVAEGR